MLERRTDLALETRESFPEDDVEIQGVLLDKETVIIDEKNNYKMDVSTVRITNKNGAKKMGKPCGSYITLETGDLGRLSDECRENITKKLVYYIEELGGILSEQRVMVCGLGNRHVTADSLGPLVVDELNITGHFAKEYGMEFLSKIGMGEMYAMAPGVMAQTGMEAALTIESIVKTINPDILIVIDALAARSISRVAATIQVTDTGINPGSGVGNHRMGLNEENMGIKVIAIGIPTVVEAEVIVFDRIEAFMEKQNFSEEDINKFISNMGEPEITNMYVTPKNIDETVKYMCSLIARTINGCMKKV